MRSSSDWYRPNVVSMERVCAVQVTETNQIWSSRGVVEACELNVSIFKDVRSQITVFASFKKHSRWSQTPWRRLRGASRRSNTLSHALKMASKAIVEAYKWKVWSFKDVCSQITVSASSKKHPRWTHTTTGRCKTPERRLKTAQISWKLDFRQMYAPKSAFLLTSSTTPGELDLYMLAYMGLWAYMAYMGVYVSVYVSVYGRLWTYMGVYVCIC